MAQRYIRPRQASPTLFVLIPSQGSIGERGLPLLPSDKHWPPLVDLILVRWSETFLAYALLVIGLPNYIGVIAGAVFMPLAWPFPYPARLSVI